MPYLCMRCMLWMPCMPEWQKLRRCLNFACVSQRDQISRQLNSYPDVILSKTNTEALRVLHTASLTSINKHESKKWLSSPRKLNIKIYIHHTYCTMRCCTCSKLSHANISSLQSAANKARMLSSSFLHKLSSNQWGSKKSFVTGVITLESGQNNINPLQYQK